MIAIRPSSDWCHSELLHADALLKDAIEGTSIEISLNDGLLLLAGDEAGHLITTMAARICIDHYNTGNIRDADRSGLVVPPLVMDIGANHGLFGLFAAVLGAQVIQLEPQKELCKVVFRCVAMRSLLPTDARNLV